MKINEVAKITGVTVRTLHYYDQIGLLKPSRITEAGYRLYDQEALTALQQILFFRELDFSLQEIREITGRPGYDRREALEKHRDMLLKKKKRIEGLIGLVDRTLKGKNDMSFLEFDKTEIEEMKERYAAEVRERWGSTAAYQEERERRQRRGRGAYAGICAAPGRSAGKCCRAGAGLPVEGLYYKKFLSLHRRDSGRPGRHVCGR